jgi:hypothetical protein
VYQDTKHDEKSNAETREVGQTGSTSGRPAWQARLGAFAGDLRLDGETFLAAIKGHARQLALAMGEDGVEDCRSRPRRTPKMTNTTKNLLRRVERLEKQQLAQKPKEPSTWEEIRLEYARRKQAGLPCGDLGLVTWEEFHRMYAQHLAAGSPERVNPGIPPGGDQR